MLTLAVLSFLLVLAKPLALIASFEIAHALFCSMFGGSDSHPRRANQRR